MPSTSNTTTFSYNGVTFNNPNVMVMESQAIYDAADASVMYTRIVIRVTGTIQFDNTYTWAQNAVYFRQTLLLPRATLLWYSGADLVNPTYDDTTGPKPRRVDLTEIVGGNFSMVNFEIELTIQEGCVSTPSNIIAHVYRATHDLDDRFYCVRTVTGNIRVRQSSSNNNPDLLRGLVVPALPQGFRRDKMSFAISLDGLSMDYSIVDREVFRTAPTNSEIARGSFSLQMDRYQWFAHLNVELKGNKNQDPFTLYQCIWNIAVNRMFQDPSVFVTQAIIEEDLFDNSVRLTMTTRIKATAMGGGIANLNTFFPKDTLIFTAVPGTETDNNDALGPYGSSMLAAAKTVFWNSCGVGDNPSNIMYMTNNNQDAPISFGLGSEAANSSAGGGSDDGVLSGTQQNYVAFDSFIEWETVYGTVMIPSTYARADGKVYQLHNPYVRIHQWGHASRLGAPVQVPYPQAITNAVIKRKYVKPFAPVPTADHQNYQYGAEWDYEMWMPLQSSDFIGGGPSPASPTIGYQDTIIGALDVPMPANIATTFDPNSTPQLASGTGITLGSIV